MAGGGGTGRFIIEPHSPYFFHPSDVPGTIITAVVFDGSNYDLWERAMRTTLRAKYKLGFVGRSLTEPTKKEDAEFTEMDAWEMANSMLFSRLLNVIDPKLRMSVAYSDAALIVWEDMRKRYAMANTPKVHQFKANLANYKQGDLDIRGFYSKLAHLWNELMNFVKMPVCTCGGCTYGVASKIIPMYEEEKTHQFLMGLNDDLYSSLRSQILALDPLPKLDRIFNMT